MKAYILIMELIGTVAFAISGAVQAKRVKMDIFGVAVMGLVTAVGGGMIRDIIIGQFPPAAFQNPVYAVTALLSALAVFFLAKRTQHTKWGEKLLYVADSIGLAVFTVVGVERAYELGHQGLTLWLFVGVITGVGGGVLRDVFCGTIPYIFRKHVYATASLTGVLTIFFLSKYTDFLLASVIGATLIVAIRLIAMAFHLNLPKSE